MINGQGGELPQPQREPDGDRDLPLRPNGRLNHLKDFVWMAVAAIISHFIAYGVQRSTGDKVLYTIFQLISWFLALADAVLLFRIVVKSVAPGFYKLHMEKWFEEKKKED